MYDVVIWLSLGMSSVAMTDIERSTETSKYYPFMKCVSSEMFLNDSPANTGLVLGLQW